MDKDNIKSTLTEYLIPLNHKFMLQQIQQLGLDKYVKKLDSVTMARLFVFAQLMQIQSYTDISLTVQHNKNLQKSTRLESISCSQLSRKLRDVDTATISLCLSKYRWADFRKTKAGVKLHLRFIHDKNGSYPHEAILTPARPADKAQMDALVVEDPNALNIFDRGYLDYRKFDSYCAQSIRFVTRLKCNADVHVIEEKPVDPSSGILREAIVRLGNTNTYLMEHPLRLIKCLDSEGNRIRILTSDFNLLVEEISDLYRSRWQIELFFKWIKQHLHVKKC